LDEFVSQLPHINASLNALATVLLVAGYVLIKRRQEAAHKWTMLGCFAVSVVFLACYLTYHYHLEGVSKKFPSYPPTAIRLSYYFILLTHIVLAAIVPFLAIATIYTGLADKRLVHRRLARWTFPIWLYVSVTGVLVYLMLYQLYPPHSP
jgi:putative membrane protein